jgi:hypothetical protein
MNIFGTVLAKDLNGAGLMGRIANVDPQQQPTVIELPLKITRAGLAKVPGDPGTKQPAPAAGNRGGRDGAGQRTT